MHRIRRAKQSTTTGSFYFVLIILKRHDDSCGARYKCAILGLGLDRWCFYMEPQESVQTTLLQKLKKKKTHPVLLDCYSAIVQKTCGTFQGMWCHTACYSRELRSCSCKCLLANLRHLRNDHQSRQRRYYIANLLCVLCIYIYIYALTY